MGALKFGEIRLDNGVVTLWDGEAWRLLSDLLGGGGGLSQGSVSSTADWQIHAVGMYSTAQPVDFDAQGAPADARFSTGTLTVLRGAGDDLMQMWMGDNTNAWFRSYIDAFTAWSAWVTSVRVPSAAGQTPVSVDSGDGQFAFYPT